MTEKYSVFCRTAHVEILKVFPWWLKQLFAWTSFVPSSTITRFRKQSDSSARTEIYTEIFYSNFTRLKGELHKRGKGGKSRRKRAGKIATTPFISDYFL